MVSITRSLALLALACVTSTTIATAQDNSTMSLESFDIEKASASFLECASAPSNPEDRRKDKTKLQYSTYNCEFLFLQQFGTLACPGKACKWKNQSMAQQHILQIAKNIHKLDSDIVQMNEVGDCAVLKAVITELQALGDSTYKPYLIRGKDSSTGQNSALITRIDPSVDLKRTEQTASIPVSGSTCPSASGYPSSKSVSKHFYTTFNVAGLDKPVTVIGAHLLANPSDTKRCYEREAQASVLAGLTNSAVLDGHHVILSGDLNDWSSTVPDHNNNKPISSALDILTGSNMVQVASYADKSTRYSEWYDENNDCVYASSESSSLDHILVSNSLTTNLRSVVFNNDITQPSCSGYNSDHWPITVSISTA